MTKLQKIKNGGILGGDDIQKDGVTKAVFEFAHEKGLVPRIVGNNYFFYKHEGDSK